MVINTMVMVQEKLWRLTMSNEVQNNQTGNRHIDSRGFTGFFICDCHEHAYHSNCTNCMCKLTKRRDSKL